MGASSWPWYGRLNEPQQVKGKMIFRYLYDQEIVWWEKGETDLLWR